MTTPTCRPTGPLLLAAVAVTVAATGCTTTPAAPPSAANTPSATAALAAYDRYWSVVDAASAAPGSRDWTAQLRDVATGPALESVTVDIANYAGLPAHQTGTIRRSPMVARADADRVAILDCVDLNDSYLVADGSGQVLDDTTNRVPRYRFAADVVAVDGRWLVERTSPMLDQPC